MSTSAGVSSTRDGSWRSLLPHSSGIAGALPLLATLDNKGDTAVQKLYFSKSTQGDFVTEEFIGRAASTAAAPSAQTPAPSFISDPWGRRVIRDWPITQCPAARFTVVLIRRPPAACSGSVICSNQLSGPFRVGVMEALLRASTGLPPHTRCKAETPPAPQKLLSSGPQKPGASNCFKRFG